MTVVTAPLLGRPVWYELMTTDMPAATDFYGKVVGWTPKPFEQSPMPYTTFNREGGAGVAGVMSVPPGVNAPPFWAMYVATPSLDDTVAHVVRLGGRECSPVVEVPTVGRMQMVQDPQGAAFYVFQPAMTDFPPEAMPQVGECGWHELMTTDAPAALRFYSDVFGWQPSQSMDMGAMGQYHMFNRPHGMIGGMMNKPPQMAHIPPHWQIYFRVAGIDEAVTQIIANGGRILNGPIEVPGDDVIINGMDPQGAAFSLVARKAA